MLFPKFGIYYICMKGGQKSVQQRQKNKTNKMKTKLLFTILFFLTLFSFSQNGPWYDRVFRATSPDGLIWTKDPTMLFDTASVPGAVKDTNGTIFLYDVYMPGPLSTETLMVATSTDGQNFSAQQPINVTGSSVIRKVDPNPILLSDGRIRLFYLDLGSPNPHNIYSAVSNDGINFAEESGIRFSKNNITDPDVFYVNSSSTWVMFTSLGTQLVRATSTDGLTFTEDASFIWNNGSVCSTFPFPGNIYRTYFCGSGGIKSATSIDGYNLTVESGVRIQPGMSEMICDPTIVQLLTNSYVMYYKSFILGTGIEETKNEILISISPNPFSTQTILQTEIILKNATLTINNIFGQNVKQIKNINGQTVTLTRDNLPSGLYFLQLTEDKKIIVTKKLLIID